MSELVEQYENLSSLMYSLEKENANNSNAVLLQVSQRIAINTYIQICDSCSCSEFFQITIAMDSSLHSSNHPMLSCKNIKKY